MAINPTDAAQIHDDTDSEHDIEEAEDIEHEPIPVKYLDRERNKLLQSRGLPGADSIPRRAGFDLVDFLVRMEPEIPSVKSKPISTSKQADKLRSILKKPLRSEPYTLAIGSYPSDARAKYVAQMIMSAAVDQYQKDRRRFGMRTMPYWHRVYGNFKDTLRDGNLNEKPCMLIISNVHDESSSTKIEKVRDLLEMYNDIPRIVVSGGSSPADLFSFRLSYPLQGAFYIGPPHLIKESK